MFVSFFGLPPVVDPWLKVSKRGKKAPGERLSALTPVPDNTELVRNSDSCLWDLSPWDFGPIDGMVRASRRWNRDHGKFLLTTSAA